MSEAAEDPVEYFLEDMRHHGKSDRTREFYGRVLREFEDHLEDRSVTPGTATHRDCMAYVHSLRGEHAESTVATYASYLHRFYAYMTQIGEFETNPMALVVEEMDERINTDPARRDVSIPEMQSFLATIGHPLDRALLVTMLKTGIRVGELCNLDLRDLAIETVTNEMGVEPRPQLSGRGDCLYVSPEPSEGEIHNGERRSASNKRQRASVVPVDDELRIALERWLAISPDPVSEADPLFTSTADHWGQRLTPHMVHHVVETHASEHGWHREGGGAAENVTPHYFRHFFTTHLRDRVGDRGIVKYLRGDVAGDVVDTYTHNWGDRVRETYLTHIYRLVE